MKGRPGSSWWLLQHELRMFWFNSSKRSGRQGWLWFLGVGWLGLHGLAWHVLHDMPALPHDVLAILAMGATLVMVVLGTFMFSSGLKSSVDSLFERGDVDLLLSSPLPSRSVFTVRLAAISLGVAGTYLALAAPVVNAGVVTGHIAWLAAYPVLLAWATVSCSLAMLLTLLLVRVIGSRKTRVVAQVLSAIAGALIFLLSQAYNLMQPASRGFVAELVTRFATPGSLVAPDSLLWLPGRAVLGSALPSLFLVVVAAVLFFFTVQFTHGFFVHGLQQAVSSVRARSGRARVPEGQFGRHLLEVVLRKEWRLIARDPDLLSQVLLQMLYLLPLGFVMLRGESGTAPGLAAGLAILSGSLTASLTWIVVAAEDAPDLLQAAPAARRVIRLAKVAAAVIPTLLLMAIPLAWAMAHDIVTGLLACFTVVSATLCAALTCLWQGRPAPRGNFKTRGKSNWVSAILELVGSFGWGGTGFLLIRAAGPGQNAYDARWASITLSIALLTLLLAWGTRRRAG
jgi:ABC-2 type transport system permease protein